MQPPTTIIPQEHLFVKPQLQAIAVEWYADLYGCDPESAAIGAETMLEVSTSRGFDAATLEDLKQLLKHMASLEAQAKLAVARVVLTRRIAA